MTEADFREAATKIIHEARGGLVTDETPFRTEKAIVDVLKETYDRGHQDGVKWTGHRPWE